MEQMEILRRIQDKTDYLMEHLPPEGTAGLTSAKNGNYLQKTQDMMEMNQWTHSFFTGMVGYLYLETGEARYAEYLRRAKGVYREKIFRHYRDTMHDLGFLYSLFAVGLYKLTGDEEAREMAVRAADELGKRFHFRAGMIQAWGQMDQQYKPGMMICDCMMNLPLLFWAYEETKHPFYLSVAMAHADTSMRYLVREDYSVRHAYQFDVRTGAPKGERNHCGYALGSAWARGTAWMLYGFAIAYSYTGEAAYRETAIGIAQFYMAQTGEDGVPVYDFRLPAWEEPKKDTSAAAVAACGLLQLAALIEEHPLSEACRRMAERTFHALSRPPYLADTRSQGLLCYEPVGPGGISIWGDYFYTELWMRFRHTEDFLRFW